MRRLLPTVALCCVGLVCGTAAATARMAERKSFSGWTGTCNNLGDCVAIATSEADFFYVRIARQAGPAAPPKVRIVLDPPAALQGQPPPLRLTAIEKGRRNALGMFPPARTGGEANAAVELTPGAASSAFIELIRNAEQLDYAFGPAKGTLGLKGLAATLRWIDAKQQRAGTTTAFVARGSEAADKVPARGAPPVVHAAKPGSVAEIAAPVVDKVLLDRTAAIEGCDADVVRAHEGYSAWRLALDTILVEVPCQRAAYNSASALYLTNAHGESPRPLVLLRGQPGEAGGADNLFTNIGFDDKAMVLDEFNKARGVADCGSTAKWVWTGTRFELLESAELLACPGALAEDWPNTFTAVRDAPPPKQVP